MSQLMSFNSIPILVLLSAIGYALSAVGMKAMSLAPGPMGLALLVGGLTLAVLSEILVLRHSNLSVVYLTIVAVETLLVLGYAASVGEVLNMRQSLGAMMVFLGMVAITV